MMRENQDRNMKISLTSLIAKLSKKEIFCGQIPDSAQSVSPSYTSKIRNKTTEKRRERDLLNLEQVFSRDG